MLYDELLSIYKKEYGQIFKVKTKRGGKNILKEIEIASRKINRNEAIKMYKNVIMSEANLMSGFNKTKKIEWKWLVSWEKLFLSLKQMMQMKKHMKKHMIKQIKQLDTTDMPDLESEESAEQRGQVLKNTDTKSSA